MSINNCVLVGRLTRNPELKKTNSNKSVVSFNLACNRRFSKEEQADFIKCIAWEKQAEFMANYLNKGALVGIEGRIQSRSYEDTTGKKVYVQEVVVENLQALESRSQRSTEVQKYVEEYEATEEPYLQINSDELPF